MAQRAKPHHADLVGNRSHASTSRSRASQGARAAPRANDDKESNNNLPPDASDSGWSGGGKAEEPGLHSGKKIPDKRAE